MVGQEKDTKRLYSCKSGITIQRKHIEKYEASTDSSDSEKTTNPKLEEERQTIKNLLDEYEQIDNESPDTETGSRVDSNNLSGSEEAAIDYANAHINREDLPHTEFDYKNKEHVEKLLESAKSWTY